MHHSIHHHQASRRLDDPSSLYRHHRNLANRQEVTKTDGPRPLETLLKHPEPLDLSAPARSYRSLDRAGNQNSPKPLSALSNAHKNREPRGSNKENEDYNDDYGDDNGTQDLTQFDSSKVNSVPANDDNLATTPSTASSSTPTSARTIDESILESFLQHKKSMKQEEQTTSHSQAEELNEDLIVPPGYDKLMPPKVNGKCGTGNVKKTGNPGSKALRALLKIWFSSRRTWLTRLACRLNQHIECLI